MDNNEYDPEDFNFMFDDDYFTFDDDDDDDSEPDDEPELEPVS